MQSRSADYAAPAYHPSYNQQQPLTYDSPPPPVVSNISLLYFYL